MTTRTRIGWGVATVSLSLAACGFDSATGTDELQSGQPSLGTNKGQPLVTICHKGRPIRVAEPAVAAHVAHGDRAKPAGLISWWPATGDATDAVDGNDGALRGDVSFVPGTCGTAFDFDAVGERVDIAHAPNLNLESLPSATFEGWFTASGGLDQFGGDAVVVAKHVCGTNTGWFFTVGQGGFIGSHWIGGLGTGAINLNDGQLHHFAVVKDGTSYFEYVDGTLTGSDSGPTVGIPSTGPVQIGGINTGSCWDAKHQLNGLVDEFAVYDRALSAAEIAALASW